MAILKCKMCGGDIELSQDKTFGTCEYCGSTMTFPKVSDDQRAAAFNRGNHFRRIGEFDKALAVYERIVREDDTDAEAHWCCALCRFGIEYVEDPTSFEWLPTCHRASFDSFLEDVDYLAAVEHSDGITRRQYQKDAAKIAEVQRGILATSQNSEPYDVFICYKESDENGNRTRDSLLAQDIYYQLTEQGRKVFFSRITLEDMVGTQYEPYIFAALNSAKVMIVVGTKAEYMNAVWVKNEWSRFLAMMKKDRSKILLPCYRDMDPYDMPEQLSVLQSYDMSKIGFIQDLIRGVAKVLDAQKKPEAMQQTVKETVVVQQTGNSATIDSLLKRVFIYLEDEEWDSADSYCERVLDMDPENGQAYLGKLMAEQMVDVPNLLKDCQKPFDDTNYYRKAYRYGDDAQKKLLKDAINHINERNRLAKCQKIYEEACAAYTEVKRMGANLSAAAACKNVIAKFKSIIDYKDSKSKIEGCKEVIYTSARAEYNRVQKSCEAHGNVTQMDVAKACDKIMAELEQIHGYQDADSMVDMCKQLIYDCTAAQMQHTQTAAGYRFAAGQFEGIPGYKSYRDAAALRETCLKNAEDCDARTKRETEKANQIKSLREQKQRITSKINEKTVARQKLPLQISQLQQETKRERKKRRKNIRLAVFTLLCFIAMVAALVWALILESDGNAYNDNTDLFLVAFFGASLMYLVCGIILCVKLERSVFGWLVGFYFTVSIAFVVLAILSWKEFAEDDTYLETMKRMEDAQNRSTTILNEIQSLQRSLQAVEQSLAKYQ